jgi:hypothetical protein
MIVTSSDDESNDEKMIVTSSDDDSNERNSPYKKAANVFLFKIAL